METSTLGIMQTDDPHFRPARPEDAERLTAIAIEAKARWGYPEEWLKLWEPELTITAEMIAREWAVVCVAGGSACAFTLVTADPEVAGAASLAHLWVANGYDGRGIGRHLVERAVDHARAEGFTTLRIVSDPFAVGFYEHMGAVHVGMIKTVPAPRELPVLEIRLA